MLESIVMSNSVVLYWDLPENYEKGDVYIVKMAEKEIARTEKCHFEVNDLSEEKKYDFSVLMTDKDGNETKIGDISCETEAPKKRIDISKAPYFAVGDGKTLNTAVIQKAIDDCKDGECVYIPAGDFMTGALRLHSNMELYLEKDAILHGTENVDDYKPKIKSRFEGIEMMCYSSLLNIGELDREKGYNCENVRICGKGTICGGGRPLAENVVEIETVLMEEEIKKLGDKIKEFETNKTMPGRVRPRLINVSSSKGITICGVTIMNGASWNVHMIYSDDIVTYGCTFRSENVWNGDGWDPDSSTNCTIFGCDFYTGDDSIAIKSGKNPEGNIINRPCEHIRVFDCVSHLGHGLTMGSEMSGGINDVRIWNCDFINSMFGVEIKGTKKRGGYVRNVSVRYCQASHLMLHSVGYNDDGIGAPTAPIFEDCVFENVRVTGFMCGKKDVNMECDAIEVSGFDEPGRFVKNVRFKNIMIDDGKASRRQMIYLQCCDGVSFENISCR